MSAFGKKTGELAAYLPKRGLGRIGKEINKKLDTSLQSDLIRNKPLLNSAAKYLYGNSRSGQALRDATTNAIQETKWGGSKSYKDELKADKELGAKQRSADTSRELKEAIKTYNNTLTMASGPERTAALEENSKKLKEALGKKTSAELAKLSKETLTDPAVMLHLSGKVYDAIQKGGNEDHSDADKVAIAAAREKFLSNMDPSTPLGAAIQEAHTTGNLSHLKTLMKSLGDKDDKSDVAIAALEQELKENTPSVPLIRALLKEVKREDMVKTVENLLDKAIKKTNPAISDDVIDIILRNVTKQEDFNLFNLDLLTQERVGALLNADQLKSLSGILSSQQKILIAVAIARKAQAGGPAPHGFDYINDPKNKWPG